MSTEKKLLIGNIVIFLVHTIFILYVGVSGSMVLLLLAIAIVAGIWSGLHAGRRVWIAYWMAIGNVVAIYVVFWVVFKFQWAAIVAANPEAMEEGISVFGVILGPVSILLVIIVVSIGRYIAWLIKKPR